MSFRICLNRFPTRAMSEITPHEAWTGEKPEMSHIRVFGCTAHMKIPSIGLKKLDDRSKPVVYLGKEPGTKAHRLLDPVTNKVHVSRDVIFEEVKAWSWEQDEQTQVTKSQFFVVTNGSETAEFTGEQYSSGGSSNGYTIESTDNTTESSAASLLDSDNASNTWVSDASLGD